MNNDPVLPPGLASRPATVDDVDAVTTLIAAGDLHDDGVVEIDRDDVAADFGNPVVDLDRDTRLVFDGIVLVAYALIEPAGLRRENLTGRSCLSGRIREPATHPRDQGPAAVWEPIDDIAREG